MQRVATIEQGAANLIMPALNPDLRSKQTTSDKTLQKVPADSNDRKLWRVYRRVRDRVRP